jgi:hypothetical protein
MTEVWQHFGSGGNVRKLVEEFDVHLTLIFF